jgi:hypothetical protein
MKWISIKDKLPELKTRCLVMDEYGFIDIAIFRDDILISKRGRYIRVTGFQDEQDEQPGQIYPDFWLPLTDLSLIIKK